MITWGIVSAAFAFVSVIPWGPLPGLFGLPREEFSFYALRLLLGVAEAGFFPGIILYLTYWFPGARRARTIALFMTAIPVNFWMPTPMQELGIGHNEFFYVGLVTAIPWGVAGIAMVYWEAHSVRSGERRWHAIGSLIVAASGLLLLSNVGGHLGPDLIGRMRAASGSNGGAFTALAGIAVVGALMMFVATHGIPREPSASGVAS